MINFDNLSPKQLSLYTAIILAIPVTLGAWFLRPEWKLVLVSFFLFVVAAYALILWVLQRFIYRRIKTIYKFIYQTKASKREEFYYRHILPQKSIDEVSEDVEKWALQREGEIAVLKSNESFRREFLQNLAHELNTPIFNIQGYLESLLDEDLSDTALTRSFLKKAVGNVHRLVALTGDLDEISKLESGQVTLLKEVFIIQELIEEVFDEMRRRNIDKPMRYQFKKSSDLRNAVYADRGKILLVIQNLVSNAFKYSNPNSTIEASVYETDGHRVLVEISDKGQGIAEEHLPRIFERFFRTDAARNRKEGGSGLGLAICKHIIEAHQQTIHVRSKMDVGTTIGFTLQSGQ